MYSYYQLALKWFRYLIYSSNGRGHGIHSPFVYELVREVLNDRSHYDAYGEIEALKKRLLRDQRILTVEDAGAGSTGNPFHEKRVSQIAAKSVSTRKFGRLLFRLARHYHARQIIELGTSLGISASYLASTNAASRVVTLEGSAAISQVAAETFRQLQLDNIIQVTGRFEDTLEKVIRTNPAVDLVFLDGNHRKEAVLDYFERFLKNMSTSSLMVIHDVHWSQEMEEAWAIIRASPHVKMTIDIFSAGLVFFREEFKVKQNFTIRF